MGKKFEPLSDIKTSKTTPKGKRERRKTKEETEERGKMARITAITLMALIALMCACAQAQDEIAQESAAMLNASLASNATAQQEMAQPEMAQQETAQPEGIEYPVFNATEVFPSGVFNADAYASWLQEVSNFYTNLYTQGAAAAMRIPRMPYTGIGAYTAYNPTGWFPGRYAEQAYSNFMNAFRG